VAIAEAVRTALRQDRFFFAFQPVVCAATGAVDYFECLLRMRDEGGQIIAGREFVTIMEELGLIGLIDHFVLEKAVQELALYPQVSLGLNISALTVGDRAWLASLISLLRQRPSMACRLVVEITETATFDDLAASARFVDTLRNVGCRVALDDFGAGHTALQQLRILPVDTVKIDGCLIRNLARNRETFLLRHLLRLARTYGLTTVAECVESAEEADLLRAEGIGYLQGYYLGRPTIERTWLRTTGPPECASA
jgi:EAL domain-containing protein (putative c-di-GMP-specific phosphodiesterase class I)